MDLNPTRGAPTPPALRPAWCCRGGPERASGGVGDACSRRVALGDREVITMRPLHKKEPTGSLAGSAPPPRQEGSGGGRIQGASREDSREGSPNPNPFPFCEHHRPQLQRESSPVVGTRGRALPPDAQELKETRPSLTSSHLEARDEESALGAPRRVPGLAPTYSSPISLCLSAPGALGSLLRPS